MRYENIVTGTFLRRPNRFLAYVLLGETKPGNAESGHAGPAGYTGLAGYTGPADAGETATALDDSHPLEVVCHVKNTGRLGELLLPGCRVLLEYHPDAEAAGRKTQYSLVGVYKKDALGEGREILVNIDSQSPNRIAEECLAGGGFSRIFGRMLPEITGGQGAEAAGGQFPEITGIRREVTYGNSRFDLAFSLGEAPAFMEVKGVTLERNGIAMFPDAPTERGVKHLRELIRARENGCEAFVLFVIQHEGVRGFTPNAGMHPEFARALREAQEAGVHVLAGSCRVAFVNGADVEAADANGMGTLSVELEQAVEICYSEC